MSAIPDDPLAGAPEAKKRRACDECRTRKLACSKEIDGCRRCKREGIACVYSAQKLMGRPRKRARNDEETESSAAPAPVPAVAGKPVLTTEPPNRSFDIPSLSEQMPSQDFTFFDFLGMNDNNVFEVTMPQQRYHHQPQRMQNTNQPNNQLPSALARSAMPELRPSVMPSPSKPGAATNRPDKFFSRSLFGINFGGIDFDPNVADSDAGGGLTPLGQIRNSSGNQAASPSGESGTSSSLDGSRSMRRNSLEDGSLHAPSTPSNSLHNKERRPTSAGVLPSSPRDTKKNSLSAPEDAKPTEADQSQPRRPSSVSAPGGQYTLLGGIPTSSPSDAYNKSSAAWLLTAPNRVCSCEARLYLALDSLQHLPAELGPALAVARAAANTAHDAILCRSCSPPETVDLRKRPPPQSFQVLAILGSLMPLIAQAYRHIVSMIDKEAARAASEKIQLPFSLTEYGGVWGSMARWDSMCGQAPSMNKRMVEPPLWRLGVRAMLKIDVYGIQPETEDAGGESQVVTSAVTVAESKAPIPEGSKADEEATEGKPKTAGPTKPGLYLTPIHFGLKDVARMMGERAEMQQLYAKAVYDADSMQSHEDDGDGSHQTPPPGEKGKYQKVVELAKKEIDRLVIV
ncbi:hypothetical protein SEPCBS119000_000159 [Sporothrix epigloea]|uniref:Zn(2)-C6 fungal-type domain-containing protein n=1 Tax=Sporothrix epigloea TaxID=1892477 RepID=A0ABP0D6B0_9PEZI